MMAVPTRFLTSCIATALLVAWAGPTPAAAARQPDVLLIMVDDLNAMIEPLGDPQAITPNLTKLANRGMVFTNAQSIAPQCNAIRTAALFGLLPSTSGVYNNAQDWRAMPLFTDKPSLPRYFRESGYLTFGAGKIFHAHTFGASGHPGFNDVKAWNDFWPALDWQLPDELKPAAVDQLQFNWGPVVATFDATIDGMTSGYVVRRIRETEGVRQPRFIAAGIYRPHAPWYNPTEYFNMYPLDGVKLPPYKADDLDDIAPAHHDRQRMKPIMEAGAWKDAVQAYLSSITLADEAVGRVLKALDESGRAGNTIIVLMSDHGYQLGEKNQREKETLWEPSLRVPFIIVAPGVTKPGSRTDVPVSSMDLYPTLVDLAGLKAPGHLEGGNSLRPLLENPGMKWDRVALSTWGKGNHSVRDVRWRYTRYADGAEELYDHSNDPDEWNNLAADPGLASVKQRLATHFPKVNVDPWRNPAAAPARGAGPGARGAAGAGPGAAARGARGGGPASGAGARGGPAARGPAAEPAAE
ncbi:MAG TPA: sulfatase [Steroidobacteraceae bacterium]|nr:sulfatase [Steroidobacteraceae bacterium]